jgi:S1-C subfamily serine protease
MSVGPGGPVLNTIAVIPEINIAGYRIGDIPVEIPENWTNQAPAVIGLPVLRRFRLMIDFHGEFVIMRPDLKLAALPFLKNRSGINVRRLDDALQVIYVAPGSPAEHAGLRVDDVIIAIDGSPLNSQYFASHHHDSSKPAGTVQRITLQGGRIVKLRLADYY